MDRGDTLEFGLHDHTTEQWLLSAMLGNDAACLIGVARLQGR